jgi:hypothetical protein
MVGPGGPPESNTFSNLPCPTFAERLAEFQGLLSRLSHPAAFGEVALLASRTLITHADDN